MKNQKISWLAKAVYAAAAILAVAPTANAMHIMEGYLPPVFCIACDGCKSTRSWSSKADR